MKKKEITVKVLGNVEQSPIAMLVQIASKFESKIYFEDENRHINAKSMMGMMTLALYNDEDVIISADGPDEDEAIAAIESFLVMK